ncbi:MAG TPA: PHB depolymerase family esterase [Myxococcota bacterium]|nr:PHB depolymerase family esterase [Myxococcota bacterium]
MGRFTPFLLALLLSAAASAQTLTPGDSSRSMVVGGLTRTYLVHVPPSYTGATAVPLVVDIHGWTSNAEQQRALSGYLALSDARGFIVVYPQGVGNAWNGGVCCTNTPTDIEFIRAMIANMHVEANIDAARVYATGLSNGGAMSHRLACEAADLFAAAAPLAFPISLNPPSSCNPSRKIPVLTTMGLTDMLVPYNGGAWPSAAATFTHWRDTNACGAGTPEIHHVSGNSYCDYDTSCADGVQVGLCSVTAQAFPGQFYDGHILYLNPDYNFAVVTYDFMSQFTLPPAAPQVPALPLAWVPVVAGLVLAAAGRRVDRRYSRRSR